MVRVKNIALTYALMPSLYCEAEFCIKCLNAVIYILFIGYSVLMYSRLFLGFFFVRSAHRGFVPLWNMADSGCGKKDQVIFKKDDELFLKGRRLF